MDSNSSTSPIPEPEPRKRLTIRETLRNPGDAAFLAIPFLLVLPYMLYKAWDLGPTGFKAFFLRGFIKTGYLPDTQFNTFGELFDKGFPGLSDPKIYLLVLATMFLYVGITRVMLKLKSPTQYRFTFYDGLVMVFASLYLIDFSTNFLAVPLLAEVLTVCMLCVLAAMDVFVWKRDSPFAEKLP